jgi:glycosyltransferase involved in cell wall biosynthesis
MHQLAGFDALVVARHFRVPFIYEVRDLWPETLVALKHRSSHSPEVLLIGAASKILYRKAAAVVTLLAGSEPRICQYGITAENVVCIPNGIDVSRVHSLLLAADRRHDDGAFTILYAGTIGFANALDQLIAAAAVLEKRGARHIKIVIMGDGPERERLQGEVRRQGLNNVEFRGAVAKERVYGYLRSADCLFVGTLPSKLYDWGMSMNKLADYLAVGRPIIMACDAPMNVVATSGAGFVVPSDAPQQLVETMLRVSSLPPLTRSAMGERGAAYAAAELDLDKLVDRYEDLLLGVVAKRESILL